MAKSNIRKEATSILGKMYEDKDLRVESAKAARKSEAVAKASQKRADEREKSGKPTEAAAESRSAKGKTGADPKPITGLSAIEKKWRSGRPQNPVEKVETLEGADVPRGVANPPSKRKVKARPADADIRTGNTNADEKRRKGRPQTAEKKQRRPDWTSTVVGAREKTREAQAIEDLKVGGSGAGREILGLSGEDFPIPTTRRGKVAGQPVAGPSNRRGRIENPSAQRDTGEYHKPDDETQDMHLRAFQTHVKNYQETGHEKHRVAAQASRQKFWSLAGGRFSGEGSATSGDAPCSNTQCYNTVKYEDDACPSCGA